MERARLTHEPRDIGVLVNSPDNGLGLGLRGGTRAIEDLRTRVGRGRAGVRVEGLGEVPREVVVSVEVNADITTVGSANRRGRVAVFAPAVAVLLVVGNAIGVGERDNNDAGRESSLDLGGGVALPTVGHASAGLLRGEQIGEEVDDIVGATSLTSVNAGHDEDARVVADGSTVELAALVRLEGWLEEGDLVGEAASEALEGGLDLLDAQDGLEIAIIDTETNRRHATASEAVTGANWDVGRDLSSREGIRGKVAVGIALSSASKLKLGLQLPLEETGTDSRGQAEGGDDGRDLHGAGLMLGQLRDSQFESRKEAEKKIPRPSGQQLPFHQVSLSTMSLPHTS